jgi:hypothetical protein
MRFFLALALAIFGAGGAAGYEAARLGGAHQAPPPVGVVRYMAGLRAWDGHAVWRSYSPDLQALLRDEGGGEAATVALYDELRARGASIDAVAYIGGYQTKDGGYFLYVTRHVRPDAEPAEVVWVLRTDADGLIESID